MLKQVQHDARVRAVVEVGVGTAVCGKVCVGLDYGMSVCFAAVILDLIQDLFHRWGSVFWDEMLKRVQHDDTAWRCCVVM